MRCVILKNRSRVPVTLQLSAAEGGSLPHLPCVQVNRLISETEKSSGQERMRDVVVNAPPSVTIPAGGCSVPLPHTVLKVAQVNALKVQRVLVVVEEKEV